MANVSIIDQPHISRKEAAIFFNVSLPVYKKRWEDHYRFQIRHVETTKGLRLSLTDVIKVAFPEANMQTVHIIAYNYLRDVHQQRIVKLRAGREKNANNDEGSSES